MTGHTIDRNNQRHKLDFSARGWKRGSHDILEKEKSMDPEALAEELSDKLIKIIEKQLKEKKAEKSEKKSQ
mgnify:CR=1 FL=1